MPKHLCFLFSDIGKGGAEKFSFNLINYFIESNHDVSVISLGKKKNFDYLNSHQKVQIHHFTRKSKFDFRPLKLIDRFAKENKVDLFICIDQFAQLYFNISRIIHCNNLQSILSPHITNPRNYKDFLNNWLSSVTMKRKLDYIVYISNNQKIFMESKYPKIKKIKNYLIHNGIDFNKYRVSSEKKNLKKSLFELDTVDCKVIIQVAGFRIEKDHQTSVKAFSILKKDFPLVKLVFLGDGDMSYINELKNSALELGLQEDIFFIGFKNDVSDYLAASDLFTLTSSSIETFSLAALEALASGLPLVLTDIGGANEIVNSTNGILVPPKNPEKIAEGWSLVLKNNYDSYEIRNNAMEFYHIDIMNKKYLDLINNII
ncbi:MAG: glycosyltransferase family 4 protein [Ferruginibacter sp.]|nr:glycosyltransferase family 4 protein [Ferruginibacter sp.]